jgi:rare lipoprotein A (peptidoglycan hydrolase)
VKILIETGKTGAMLMLTVIVLSCFMAEPAAIATITAPSPADSVMAGYASYYSYECSNRPMANGVIFDPEKRTCASWFYKFGTVLEIKNLETGLATEVTVTDRGPNKRLVRDGRIIDLSRRSFEDICALEKGLARVRVTVKSAPNEAAS